MGYETVACADFIFASKPNDCNSPPGRVILSKYDKPAVNPLFPNGTDKETPPALIGTSLPVPAIPLKVGLDRPNKDIDSPNPKGELKNSSGLPLLSTELFTLRVVKTNTP